MTHSSAEQLAKAHFSASDPDEPYRSIDDLFDGDLHATGRSSLSRERWTVISQDQVRVVRVEREPMTSKALEEYLHYIHAHEGDYLPDDDIYQPNTFLLTEAEGQPHDE